MSCEYSVGWAITCRSAAAIGAIPKTVWADAIDADGGPPRRRRAGRDHRVLPARALTGWPSGMRVIVRRERPHPGAQLDAFERAPTAWRYTAFATNTRVRRSSPHLEARHRAHARVEDRIRIAKDTGLRNLPLHDLDQNRIWCALVALACEVTTWAQMLALTEHPARRWEPKRLRLRIFSIAARLARSARRTLLHLPEHAPWAALLHGDHPPAHPGRADPTRPPTGPWNRRHPSVWVPETVLTASTCHFVPGGSRA